MADQGNPFQKAIVVKWGQQYYYVTQERWMEQEMPDDLKTEVEYLVNKGAVLAAIPSSGPTLGCTCYLVNLSSVQACDYVDLESQIPTEKSEG